ncbi:MAG: universal stress protein [Gallionella sp.]|nr:universal stress protein [Gallionella sp.]
MKMLVCHDGSESAQSALEKSVAMFRSERPEIILVTVAEEPADASSYDEAAFEAVRSEKEADLREAADWVVKQGLDVDAVMAIGDPRKMLVEAVKKKKPDIVVIASRPPQGGVRFGNITVSVSDYLIHHITDCPVLVMH